MEIAEFSLATSETWRDRNSGERKEKTEWHKIKIMNDALVKNVVRPYVKKGSMLYIEGKLETESWEDRNGGGKKYATKIVVQGFGGGLQIVSSNGDGERRSDSGGNGGRSNNNSHSGYGSGSSGGRPGNGGGGFSHDMDDDIPFAPEFR
jgi:single-strand DNA-binding protein